MKVAAEDPVKPDELGALNRADPQVRTDYDLSEECHYPGTSEPVYWHVETLEKPGFWALAGNTDVAPIHQDFPQFSSERENALETLPQEGLTADVRLQHQRSGTRERDPLKLLNGFSGLVVDFVTEQANIELTSRAGIAG